MIKTYLHANLFILILVLVCTIPPRVQAVNYWNWGVETDVTSQGNRVAYFGSSSAVATAPHSGSRCMRIEVIGNDNGNQQLGADNQGWNTYSWNFAGSPTLYYRWWMKIDSGFNWGGGTAKTKSSRVGGSARPRGYTGYVMKKGFAISECDGTGGCLDTSGKNYDLDQMIFYDIASKADSRWHEYIVMVKPNSTITARDAQFKAWVDGQLVGQYLNWAVTTLAGSNQMSDMWGCWMNRPYFQLNGTATDGGTIYLDDFSTDDEWNSLISAKTVRPSLNPVQNRSCGLKYSLTGNVIQFTAETKNACSFKVSVYTTSGKNVWSCSKNSAGPGSYSITMKNTARGMYVARLSVNGLETGNVLRIVNY